MPESPKNLMNTLSKKEWPKTNEKTTRNFIYFLASDRDPLRPFISTLVEHKCSRK